MIGKTNSQLVGDWKCTEYVASVRTETVGAFCEAYIPYTTTMDDDTSVIALIDNPNTSGFFGTVFVCNKFSSGTASYQWVAMRGASHGQTGGNTDPSTSTTSFVVPVDSTVRIYLSKSGLF